LRSRAQRFAIALAIGLIAALVAFRATRPTSSTAGASHEQASATRGQPAPPAAVTQSRSASGHGTARKTHVDPARRAELKRLIEAAAAQPEPRGESASAGRAATTSAAPGAGPVRNAGSVEEYARFIQDRLRDDFGPMASDCFDELKRAQPDASGTVLMDFKILGRAGLGGLVDSAGVNAESTLRDASFEQCLRSSFLSVYFDPPPGGGEVTMHYPFAFGRDAGFAEHQIHLRDRRNETAR
jgi:hypothetical protein